MSAAKYRVTGAHRIDPNTALWARVGGGSWAKYSFSTGLFYVIDHGGDAADLLTAFIDAVQTASGNANFDASLDRDTGKITVFNNDLSNSVEVSWTDPAASDTDESAVLGFALFNNAAAFSSGFTLAASSEAECALPHAYGVYPSRIYLDDLPVYEVRGAQAYSDGGNVTTTVVATPRKHKLTVRLKDSIPRKATWNEYHSFEQFWKMAATGLPFRYYPDRDVAAAWAGPGAGSPQPFGYQTWVLSRESWTFEPAPVVGNWYGAFDQELMLREYVAPA